MDISALYGITSGAIQETLEKSAISKPIDNTQEAEGFGSLLNAAIENISTTNAYLSDAENEELKLMLGETDNPHDLTIALSKASTALQYTVAVRDKFLEAYKEIMQIQI